MKKNWIMRSAYLLLAILLISTVAVSGTFAKYTWTSNDISDTTEVAKFAFKVNDSFVDEKTDTITIGLFDTILEEDESTETDVKAGMIAPGTRGAFDLSFQNLSDVTVAVDYSVDPTSKLYVTMPFRGNVYLPLEFTLTPDVDDSWVSIGNVMNQNVFGNAMNEIFSGLDKTTVTMNQTEAIENIVYWRWAYEENDTLDTSLGFYNPFHDQGEIELKINITVTQVN